MENDVANDPYGTKGHWTLQLHEGWAQNLKIWATFWLCVNHWKTTVLFLDFLFLRVAENFTDQQWGYESGLRWASGSFWPEGTNHLSSFLSLYVSLWFFSWRPPFSFSSYWYTEARFKAPKRSVPCIRIGFQMEKKGDFSHSKYQTVTLKRKEGGALGEEESFPPTLFIIFSVFGYDSY